MAEPLPDSGRGRPVRRHSEARSYGPWHDGPDPLKAPADLRDALDEIGRDVMNGSSPRSALEELLRRGTRNTQGLDDLTRRLWERRREIQRRHNLDGTLRDVQRLLDEALEAERHELFPNPSDDARFQEAELDALPAGTAAAVRELANYDWQSSEAREKYEEIRELLGRELLGSRFEGMKEALQQTTPEDVERINEMLTDLNALLAAHAQGRPEVPQLFDEFMAKHGEFFPENPHNVDELIDVLAQRAAAAQRMMNSMTPEQRAELAELSQQAFGSPQLAQQLAQLDAQLQSLRPGEDWSGSERMSGDDPLGLAEGARAMSDLAELDALAEQLAQSLSGCAAGGHRPRRAHPATRRRGDGRCAPAERARAATARSGAARTCARRIVAIVAEGAATTRSDRAGRRTADGSGLR